MTAMGLGRDAPCRLDIDLQYWSPLVCAAKWRAPSGPSSLYALVFESIAQQTRRNGRTVSASPETHTR